VPEDGPVLIKQNAVYIPRRIEGGSSVGKLEKQYREPFYLQKGETEWRPGSYVVKLDNYILKTYYFNMNTIL
jgi:hypothetical protein